MLEARKAPNGLGSVIVVAIDIGGTFTDLIGFDDAARRFVEAKSLTTPAHLVQGIIDCIRKSGLDASAIDELIHGSTIAINTLIERKGARTGLVVTRGTRDVYIIGRGNRPEAYNLLFHRHRPLVPRHLTLRGRRAAAQLRRGARALDRAARRAGLPGAAAEGVEAVAVCFLHSYVNPEHERIAGEIIRAAMPEAYLSLSHEILREYREFERMSTTVVNAYIGPKVGGYVRSLQFEPRRHRVSRRARDHALERRRDDAGGRDRASGRDDGIGAGRRHHRLGAGRPALGSGNVISFDMGGTTAKASLVRDGEPTLAPGYYVGGYASGHPVMLPMIDVVEVGAGGGSIAWLDEVGALKVGPHSAGADPGPICYRGGGTEPTITDANVVLGRLDPDNFLGGEMKLDADGARARHQGEDRRPARAWTRSPPRRPSSRSPSPRCRWRCARSRSPRATIRAISRWSRRAAPARCTWARSRASCTSPRSSCRCSPRTSPRSACCWRTSATISSAPSIAISPAPTSRSWRRSIDEMVAEASAGLRHAARRRASKSTSTCAMSGRSSRCRYR